MRQEREIFTEKEIPSKKMVLMNLSSGHESRCERIEWTCGHRGGKGGGNNPETSTDVYTSPCVKQTGSASCCMAQGAQFSAL